MYLLLKLIAEHVLMDKSWRKLHERQFQQTAQVQNKKNNLINKRLHYTYRMSENSIELLL